MNVLVGRVMYIKIVILTNLKNTLIIYLFLMLWNHALSRMNSEPA